MDEPCTETCYVLLEFQPKSLVSSDSYTARLLHVISCHLMSADNGVVNSPANDSTNRPNVKTQTHCGDGMKECRIGLCHMHAYIHTGRANLMANAVGVKY